MRKLVTLFVTIGGLAEFAIGILHIIWPYDFFTKNEFAHISVENKHFVLLLTLYIGFCLIIFGFLTLLFVKKLKHLDRPSIIFCISQGFLWLGRFSLEIIYPVKISVFTISNISIYIIIGSLILSALFFSVFSLLIYDTNH